MNIAKKNTFISCLVTFSCLFSLNVQAGAVLLGSQYDYYLGDNGGTDINTVTFDGIDETFNNITISEAETALGNNQYLLEFSFFSDFDIFEGTDRGLSAVAPFNSLDLNGMFNYISGTLNLFNTNEMLIASINLGTNNNDPWDGSSPGASSGWVLNQAIDNEIGRIDYALTIARVPEPSSLLLFVLGFVALRRIKFLKR